MNRPQKPARRRIERMRDLPEASLDAVNARLASMDWRSAMAGCDAPGVADARKSFENRRKGYFHLMMGGPRGGRALDVGAGSGIVSEILGSWYSSVVAVDVSGPMTRFMAHRFRQDRLPHVRVVRADGLRLPFRDESFDLVVVNGVLEWLPAAAPGRDPGLVQQQFLERCRRLLRPGGRLGIAIENRWNYNHLLGRAPHGDLPFTTLLPRVLASWVNRALKRGPYTTYIYSYRGLVRLLTGAGFVRTRGFTVLPSYYDPILVLPLDSTRVMHDALTDAGNLPGAPARRALYRLLSRAGVLKYALHSFLAVGERDA